MKLTGWAALTMLLVGNALMAEEKEIENKLPDAVAKALEKATEVQVYSLAGETNQKSGWHGTKVLGKTSVTKASEKKVLATAMKKGVDEGANGARCFIPRHGLSVTHDGTTYDLVICFECHWVYIYTSKSDKPTVLLISDSPQQLLNKILKDAKVPLAKADK